MLCCQSEQGAPFPLLADIVAKVFLGWRTKILRAADAFYARRREGPYRFIQNRSRTSVLAFEKRRSSREVQRSTFARFSGSLDFRLLQQYRPTADVIKEAANCCGLTFSKPA